MTGIQDLVGKGRKLYLADVGRALHHVPVGFYFRFSFLLFFFSLLSYSSRIPPRTSTEVGCLWLVYAACSYLFAE